MASSGVSHLYGGGKLFGIAMATSMAWYMFWLVMNPVRDDIAPLINWYVPVGVA